MGFAQIAELAAPFAKWLAILAAAVGGGLFGWSRIRKGAKDELRVEVLEDLEKERQDAHQEYREDLADSDARWDDRRRRARLSDGQRRDDRAAR